MNESNTQEEQPDSPARRERKQETERTWKEHPIREYHKSQDLTKNHASREEMVLGRFEKFLAKSELVPDVVSGVRDVVETDIRKFVNDDLDNDPQLGDRTIIDYLDILSKFYTTLVDNNAIGTNPVDSTLSEERENRDWDSPDRPFISFTQMKTFLKWLDTPFARAFQLTGLKTASRAGETINTDLRCCHIDHPVFWNLVEKYDVTLDPRVRDKPDSILIYEEFNADDEIPDGDTPGPEKNGETRKTGNKRKEESGSVIPIDSELKTALIEYLLVRPETTERQVQPLFTNKKQEEGGSSPGRLGSDAMRVRLFWSENTDSVKIYGEDRALSECPNCGGSVVEWNPVEAEKTGRVFECEDCGSQHRRPVLWDHGLSTEQKFTFHVVRHFFSDAHRAGSSELHNGELLDRVRQYRIRGDRNSGDADSETYQHKENQDWERDVREPYLDAVYKFGVYDKVISAVGET